MARDDRNDYELNSLFPGCLGLGATLDAHHKQVLQIRLQDWQQVIQLKETHLYYFAKLAQDLHKDAVELWHEGDEAEAMPSKIRIPAKLAFKRSCSSTPSESLRMSDVAALDPLATTENPFLSGLVTDSLLRLQQEVYQSSRPAFLVSINYHRNLIFNQAGLDLLDSTPQQLLKRNLSALWVPPQQLKPVSYQEQPPPHLAEILKLLRQQSELNSFSYLGWRNQGDERAEWGRWTSDIRVREVAKGHYARLMLHCGWDPLPLPS